MMSRRVSMTALALALVVLGGCAAPKGTASSAVQQISPTMKLIDAAGGEYEEFTQKLDLAAHGFPQVVRVITTVLRQQPTDKWNPTVNVCANHKRSGASHCLHTHATRDGSRLIAQAIWKPAEGVPHVTTQLPFDLWPSGEHYLDIVLWSDRLVMIIDDREIMDHPTQVVPDEIWYSCSSVVCSVDVVHPYSRSSGKD